MPLFVPSSRVIVNTGESHAASRFVLASTEWFALQNSVQAVLALPFDFDEYTNRYGDASSGLQMRECFSAMHKLRQVATRYGSPRELRRKVLNDPNLFAGQHMPANDAYAAIAWTIQRAHRDASSLASALGGIPANARREKPSDVVAGIKDLFLGTDQVADKMHETVGALEKVARDLAKLDSALAENQSAMDVFTARSSTTRMRLDEEIGTLRQKVARLESDRDAVYRKWLDLTIAAATVSTLLAISGVALNVILAAPTGGASLVVGSAIGVGVVTTVGGALSGAAGVARSSYEALVSDAGAQSEFLQKRIAYRHDLGALEGLMKFSLPASNSLVEQVEAIKEGWKSSIEEIRFRVSDLTVDNLRVWLDEQEMTASAANWARLDEALKAFVVGSLVDYDVIPFGSPLPADDPNWLNHFVERVAA